MIGLYANLGILNNKLFTPNTPKALEYLRRAESICRATYGDIAIELPEIYMAQGIAYLQNKELKLGYGLFDKSINITSDLFGLNHIQTKRQILNVAYILLQNQDYVDCIFRLAKWPEKQNTLEDGRRYYLLGAANYYNEMYDVSREQYKKALNIFNNLEKEVASGEDVMSMIKECKSMIKALK